MVFASAMVLAVTLTACGGGSSGSATLRDQPSASTTSTATTASTPAYVSYIATAKSTVPKVSVYDSPDASAPSF